MEAVDINSVEIHQTLHGYSHGHCLLASSRQFDKDTSRILQMMTDLSGPGANSNFSPYLTGYPLTPDGTYALGMTWNATEMSRPGCVLTHSMILETSHWEVIRDLSCLLRFFVRPAPGGPLDSYGEPLVLSPRTLHSGPPSRGVSTVLSLREERLAPVLLQDLYSEDSCESPLALPASSARDFERAILEIWSQMWPSFRRSFSFCTGSLSIRSIDGTPLDLQVFPENLSKRMARGEPRICLVDWESSPPAEELPDWLDLAVHDLRFPHPRTLREFLRCMDLEGVEGRTVFRQLGVLFLEVLRTNESRVGLGKVLDLLRQLCPDPTQGRKAKRVLLGRREEAESCWFDHVPEAQVLRELATYPSPAFVFEEDLELQARAIELWRGNKSAGIELVRELTSTTINPLGEDLIRGIAEGISEYELTQLRTTDPRLYMVFLSGNPSFACAKEFWMVTSWEQRELLQQVARATTLEEGSIREIVRAMIEANANAIADDAFQSFGETVIWAFLEAHSEMELDFDRTRALHGWERLVEEHSDVAVRWLDAQASCTPKTAAFILSRLNPLSPSISATSPSVWLRTAEGLAGAAGEPHRIPLAEFLLPLGLTNAIGDDSVHLVTASFEVVHAALSKNQLSWKCWKILDDVLPAATWYRTWDKCRRLRLGLLKAFSSFRWPIEELVACVRREDLRQLLNQTAAEESGNRSGLEQVWEEGGLKKTRTADFYEPVDVTEVLSRQRRDLRITSSSSRRLEAIEFNYSDSPANHGWSIELGEAEYRVETEFPEPALRIDPYDRFIMDYRVQGSGREASHLDIIRGRLGMWFYVRLLVANRAGAHKRVWIAFPPEPVETRRFNDSEWWVYVEPVATSDRWCQYRLDLHTALEDTFGKGWRLQELVRIRIGGESATSMSRIVLT